MTADERIGNTLGVIALVALPIILGVTLYISHKVKAVSIGQAREDRGKGIPYTNIERACRHWNITPEQYLVCPGCYPLPDRGAGLYG